MPSPTTSSVCEGRVLCYTQAQEVRYVTCLTRIFAPTVAPVESPPHQEV